MNRSPTTRRIVAIGVVLSLAVAACGGDGADPERFCEVNAELEDANDPVNLPPDEARAAMPAHRDLLEEAKSTAPDELRPSVVILVDALTLIYDALEEADFDGEQMNEDAIPDEFFDESSDFGTAADTLQTWLDANCSA